MLGVLSGFLYSFESDLLLKHVETPRRFFLLSQNSIYCFYNFMFLSLVDWLWLVGNCIKS